MEAGHFPSCDKIPLAQKCAKFYMAISILISFSSNVIIFNRLFQIYPKGKRGHVKIRRGLGLINQPSSVQLHEAGTILARRALAHGTLWAVFGCSVLFYSIWKLSGAKDLKDFRLKAGAILPRIPRNGPGEGRTEFSGYI